MDDYAQKVANVLQHAGSPCLEAVKAALAAKLERRKNELVSVDVERIQLHQGMAMELQNLLREFEGR